MLPARVRGYGRDLLDELCWRRARLARRRAARRPDGRIALYRATASRCSLRRRARPKASSAWLRERCGRRGASFFAELVRESGRFRPTCCTRSGTWSGPARSRTTRSRRCARAWAPRRSERRGRGRAARPRGLPGSEGRWSLVASRRAGETSRRLAGARAARSLRRADARGRAERRARAPSPRSTPCSRRWRSPARCGAATSSPASAARSSRSPAPTIACACCAARGATGDGRARRHRSRQPLRCGAALAAGQSRRRRAASKQGSPGGASARPGPTSCFCGARSSRTWARPNRRCSRSCRRNSPSGNRRRNAIAGALGQAVDGVRRRALLLSEIDGAEAGSSEIARVLLTVGSARRAVDSCCAPRRAHERCCGPDVIGPGS